MSGYLDKIKKPSDLKGLSTSELLELSGEIREFLIENVTRTGGHLASNLGVVELTIALLKVFDVPYDKIIFDVGHQSYVYKLLTGRKEGFKNLRQFGGMSGFPKTSESEYDCFNTGHSSTSASAAIGMARARDLKKENQDIIAVFGDGALTGGMIYEAMNDTGHNKNKVIYILNDNEMSISENVGALSAYLAKFRRKPGYFRSKEIVQKMLAKMPLAGEKIGRGIKNIKRLIRRGILSTIVFEDFGLEYYGPVNGHDIDELTNALLHAKKVKKSIIIHIHTVKGKGYLPAEENPMSYHGISPIGSVKHKDFSNAFGESLLKIAKENEKVVAVTGAMPVGTGLDQFSKIYPERYFDVGIAEQHAVCMAAGLAISGMVPVVPLYSSFMQRAYDQILHDVCLQNLHVIFPVDRAGIVGADGETHQGMHDISFLYAMPNMTILSPADYKQLNQMLDFAINVQKGPVAIRYPRGCEIKCETPEFSFGRGYVLEEGKDIVIFTTGRMIKTAHSVANILTQKGIEAKILVFPTIKPLDEDLIIKSVKGKKLLVTIEDGVIYGGFSSAVSMLLAKEGNGQKMLIKAFPDKPIPHGTQKELDNLYGMDAETIAREIMEELNER